MSEEAKVANLDDMYLFMNSESKTHNRTWMALPSEAVFCTEEDLPHLRNNIILLAKTISKYEPVYLIVTTEDDEKWAKERIKEIDFQTAFEVELIRINKQLLWIRDILPFQVMNLRSYEFVAIQFDHRNPEEKEPDVTYDKLTELYFFMTYSVDSELLYRNIVRSQLKIRSGDIEVDGLGTGFVNATSIMDDNPGRTRKQIRKEIKKLYGLQKTIWLPVEKGKRLDEMVRLVGEHGPTEVLFNLKKNCPASKECLTELENRTTCHKKKFNITKLNSPDFGRTRLKGTVDESKATADYINYYVCNGAVICAEFGDKEEDAKACEILKEIFPGRKIEQLNLDYLSKCGGGIHRATIHAPY